ncbi:MAG: hypothetical protein A2Z29_06700 [Chloroflexi bacterium RBG_16_56_11]|nr:MAG: hypothetical protein A2Z29_06700 [Chloroflexi bacterium RBG_16_56_11]
MSTPLKPLKWYRQLADKKGRLEAGAFLVEGDRAVRQVTGANPAGVMEIIATTEWPSVYAGHQVNHVTSRQFQYISSTRTPQGIAAVVRLPGDIYSDRLPEDAGNRILLLEDIQDPGNTGTLIRTAAAFGFSGVIMTENGADPLSPKCVQSTAGTVLSVWLRRTTGHSEMVKDLKTKGFIVVAADVRGDTGPEVIHYREKLLIVLGNEASGLSTALLDMADYRLRIPTVQDKAESLNVAACGAILMYLSAPEITG